MAKHVINALVCVLSTVLASQVTSLPVRNSATATAATTTTTGNSFSNLIKDAGLFQKELAANFPGQLTATAVILHFPSLSLENLGCSQFRLVERLQEFAEILHRFSIPINMIRNEMESDTQKRSLADIFMKIQNAYGVVSIQLRQVLHDFQANFIKSRAPSISELNRNTQKYLTVTHPEIQINQSNIKIFRDYSFVQSLIRVVKMMMSELRNFLLLRRN